MYYLTFYLLTVPVAYLCVFLSRPIGTAVEFTLLLTFVATFGLSYMVGPDWYNYSQFYEQGANLLGIEPFYTGLQAAFSTLGINFWVYLFLVKLACYVLIYRFFKAAAGRYGILAFLCFSMAHVVYLNDFVRQLLAFALFIAGVTYIERSLLKFSVLVALATQFHYSAVALLPLWLLIRFPAVRGLALASIIPLFVFGLLGYSYLAHIIELLNSIDFSSPRLFRLQQYLDIGSPGLTVGRIVRIVVVLIYSVSFHYYFKNNVCKENKLAVLAYCGSLLLIIYELLFYDSIYIWSRFAIYFTIFYYIYPFIIVNRVKPHWAPAVGMIVIFYSSYAFIGFITGELFSTMYANYNNIIFHPFVPSASHELRQEKAAEEFWLHWGN